MKYFFTLIGIVAIITSIFFFYQAYDKYVNYENSESYSKPNINSYVGGDAYNYIINGTYFTGFSVIGSGCLLFGIISFGVAVSAYYNEQKMESIAVLRRNLLENINSLKKIQ